VSKRPVTVSSRRQSAPSALGDNQRRSLRTWQDQIRDPSLTVLLVLELCAIFVAVPLAAKGLPMARAIVQTLVLGALVIVVMLSQKWGAIILILLGLAATAGSFPLSVDWSPVSATMLRRAGEILAFSALIWVIAHAVYAPGRITFHRLQGAVVVYLSLATIFASAYSLIWELSPGAFANLLTPVGGPEEIGAMLYFSLTTLTTTGYGDIVAVDPFARSLANFESVLGQFFIAITVARLVTMELADRHR
jgi:Ion channel